MKYHPEQMLALASRTARRAGRLLLQLAGRPVEVLQSQGRDLKLRADRQSEALIVKALRRHSDYPILTEESGALGEARLSHPLWIVDPLDGTANFSRGIPLCCTCIALWDRSRPVLGVIYDFANNNLYTGLAGHGAFLNGRRIRVSSVRNPAQGILVTGFPLHSDLEDAALQRTFNRIRAFKKVRMLGSAAMSLAFVAGGQADAYVEQSIMLWDVAAGLALVRAAGGRFTMTPTGHLQWCYNIQAAASTRLFVK